MRHRCSSRCFLRSLREPWCPCGFLILILEFHPREPLSDLSPDWLSHVGKQRALIGTRRLRLEPAIKRDEPCSFWYKLSDAWAIIDLYMNVFWAKRYKNCRARRKITKFRELDEFRGKFVEGSISKEAIESARNQFVLRLFLEKTEEGPLLTPFPSLFSGLFFETFTCLNLWEVRLRPLSSNKIRCKESKRDILVSSEPVRSSRWSFLKSPGNFLL